MCASHEEFEALPVDEQEESLLSRIRNHEEEIVEAVSVLIVAPEELTNDQIALLGGAVFTALGIAAK